MTSTVTLLMWAALAANSPKVLVLPYQSLDVSEAEVARLGEGLRAALKGHAWEPIEEAASQKLHKAAEMCGEDGPCLATLGQRAGAQWVVAFSVGRVQKGVVASTMLVEVSSAQQRSRASETVEALPEDFTNLARALVDPLFRDVPGQVRLVPAAGVVAAPPSKLTPAGVGLLIGGGVLGAGGLALSVAAGFNFAGLQTTSPLARPGADATQRGLNVAADVTVGVAIAALATGVVLLIADAASGAKKPEPGEESSEAQGEAR